MLPLKQFFDHQFLTEQITKSKSEINVMRDQLSKITFSYGLLEDTNKNLSKDLEVKNNEILLWKQKLCTSDDQSTLMKSRLSQAEIEIEEYANECSQLLSELSYYKMECKRLTSENASLTKLCTDYTEVQQIEAKTTDNEKLNAQYEMLKSQITMEEEANALLQREIYDSTKFGIEVYFDPTFDVNKIYQWVADHPAEAAVMREAWREEGEAEEQEEGQIFSTPFPSPSQA